MGPLGGADPNVQGDNLADVKNAVAMLMEQQQQGEAQPRPPTDAEAAQLRQKAMEMIQAKKGGVAAAGPSMGAPTGAAPAAPPQPMGPANVPPATGKGSANEAMDDVLMSAKAQTPQAKDVKTPGLAAPGAAGWNARIDSNVADIDKLLSSMRAIQTPQVSPVPMVGPGIGPAPMSPGGGTFPLASDAVDTLRQNSGMVDTLMNATGHPAQPSAPSAQPPSAGESQPDWRQGDFSDIDKALEQAKAIDNGGNPQSANMSPGGNFENWHPGEFKTEASPEVMNSVTNVASKAFQAGIDSFDKAKTWLNNSSPEFKTLLQDPEYRDMLAKLEQNYADAQKRTDEASPGVTQYIAAALLGLAGVHPQIISHVLHPDDGKNLAREQLAGHELMQMRLHGLADRQQAFRQQQNDAKLAEQQKIADMKEAGLNRRADQEFNFKRLQGGRGENLKLALEYLKAGETATTHSERVAAAAKAAPYLKIENEYRKKLGEPAISEQELQKMIAPPPAPKPQSMIGPAGQPAQPDQGMQQNAMRLIGLGA